WWLNLACAHLDGLVGAGRETTSMGDGKAPTLPFLTGREIHAGHNRLRYLRESTLAGMPPALVPQTGKHVRVLSGNQLHSHLAPRIGIRDDGLRKVLKHSERLIHTTGRYRLEVDLEKSPGQPAMSELMRIPRSSHLDDWDLYKRLKADKDTQGAYRHGSSWSEEAGMVVKHPRKLQQSNHKTTTTGLVGSNPRVKHQSQGSENGLSGRQRRMKGKTRLSLLSSRNKQVVPVEEMGERVQRRRDMTCRDPRNQEHFSRPTSISHRV
ncbi:hypothetical protein C8A01DRAFT_19822, partial [Parachaetomium inaequale]